MQPRTLLLLTVTVLALGAFIFFYEKDLPTTDEHAELAKKVLRLEDQAIEALLIEWGDSRVRLARQRPPSDGGGDDAGRGGADDGGDAVSVSPAAGWRIIAPLDARADGGAVDSLVSSLTGLEFSRAFEDFDRGELGLDDPRARVTLVASGDQKVLEIGAELPASSDMVVTVTGGAKAYQVASSLFSDLTKDPGEWRDKKLFAGLRSDVERLTLEAGGEKVVLARRGEVAPEGRQSDVAPEGRQRNTFWIESPLTDRADQDRVNALLSELTDLRVESFLDEPLLTPESLGLEPPRGVVEAVLAGEAEPFRLELGHVAGDDGDVVYGRADSQLFELKTRLTESLAATAADWRSKSWTALQVFEIEAAAFADSEGTVEISRDGADWQRGEDRVSYTVVSDLLYPITEAKGEQVVERAGAAAAGHDLEQPSLRVTLSTEDGDRSLQLFPALDGLAAATSGGRRAVLLLAEETASEILDKLRDLRTAEPLPAAEEDGEPEDGEPEDGEPEEAEPIE